MLNSISSCFRDSLLGSKRIGSQVWLLRVVTSSVTWPFDSPWPLLVVFWNQASIFNGFRVIDGECDSTVYMTLNYL